METNSPKPYVAYGFMAALLVILPIEGTAALRNFLLAGSLIAFLTHVQRYRLWSELRFPLKWLWLAYAVIALINLLWAVDVLYSLSEIRHEIVIAALVFWLAYNLFSQGGLNWMLGGVLVGNAFLVFSCLALFWLNGREITGLNGTFQTGVGNYSTYLILAMPLLVWVALYIKRLKQPVWTAGLWLLVLLNLLAVLITQNRQTLVALAAECLGIFLFSGMFRKVKYWVLLVSISGMLGGLFVLQTTSRGYATNVSEAVAVGKALQSDGRLSRWAFALSEGLSHPLSGGGLGRETFQHLYPGHPMTAAVYAHTHNMIVNRVVQLGFPGALFFLMLMAGPVLIAITSGGTKFESKLRWVSLSLFIGMLTKNMTDDFFMRELGYLYWILTGSILGTLHTYRSRLDPNTVGTILIIRRDNIGDLLCTTPLIHALRKRYPAARIDALVNSYNAPVLVGNPDLDHVYHYTKAKHREANETVIGVFWRRIRLLWNLRQVGYGVVILAGDGNPDRQRGLARWLDAGCVIGYAPEDGRLREGLDVAVPKQDGGHEVERTFALLAPLGITDTPGPMVLVPDINERTKAAAALAAVPGTRTVAIHISARKVPQRWPVERFAETMRMIHAETGARFMLFWSPGDENNPLHPGDDQKAAALLALIPDIPVLPYPTERLAELMGGLSQCDAMICADGGAMHIGAALGLPIIALFGNSDAGRWHPWGVRHQLLQMPSRDVNDLQVSEALSAYEALGVARDIQSTMSFTA